MKFLYMLLAVLGLAYLGGCAYLYGVQRSLLYFPTPPVAIEGVDSVPLSTDGATLKIWRLGTGSDAVIYFGGNAEDVAQNIPAFGRAFAHRSVYLVNYRGYGGSSGKPSEAALLADALAIYDAVRPRHARIAVIGRSLGSGVAVYLASRRPVERLVLVTPFDSIESLAKSRFPLMPVSLLIKDRFLSSRFAAGLHTPALVLLAEHDEVVPRPHSDRLIAALRQVAPQVVVMSGTTHNSIADSSDYVRRMQRFLDRP